MIDCPFRYQGQYLDNETGLYYNRFRYYDPEQENYISKDPIGLNGDNPTLYGYVHNPNKSVDYLGLDVYELTAGVDGWYPVYEKGSLNPVAYERLDAGDTYKIGESINSSKRYSQAALDEARINRSKATSVAVDSNGKVMLDVNGKPIPAGLDMNKVDVGGTKIADRRMETDLITDYEDNNNKLPAGNKTHH